MTNRWPLAAAALIFLSAVVLSAPEDDLARSPIAGRITDFIRVFNGGDESALHDWIRANYADSVLLMRSADLRMDNFRRMREDMTSLTLEQVLVAEPTHTLTYMRSAHDQWFQIDFVNDPNPPHRLFGLSVNIKEPEQAPPVTNAAPAVPLHEYDAIDSTDNLLAELTASDEFSGVVWIARNGKPVYREAFGYADRESHTRNRPDTKFNIGSIDKSFTRIAIERLIADGRLSRDTIVGAVLPDYPNPAVRDSVTVGQLLDHKAGVPDFFGEEFMRSNRDSIRTLRDYLKFFSEKPLDFPPGSREQYSNGGYILLGLIIEQLTGESYYDHIRHTIFEPLRMKDSDWYATDEQVRNLAIGYTHRWSGIAQDSPELRPNTSLLPARGSSAGGSYASAEDLLKFVNALERGKLSSSEGSRLGIAGGAPGLNAALESGLPNGYTVIVLSNLDPPSAERVASRLRRWLALVKF